jgi:hypothetical protein
MKRPVLWPEIISGCFSLGIEINGIKTTVVYVEMPCYYRKHFLHYKSYNTQFVVIFVVVK